MDRQVEAMQAAVVAKSGCCCFAKPPKTPPGSHVPATHLAEPQTPPPGSLVAAAEPAADTSLVPTAEPVLVIASLV